MTPLRAQLFLLALGAALPGNADAREVAAEVARAYTRTTSPEAYLLCVEPVAITALFEVNRVDGTDRVIRSVGFREVTLPPEQLSAEESAAVLLLFRNFNWNVKLLPPAESRLYCEFGAPPRITFHARAGDSQRAVQADGRRLPQLADLLATLVSKPAP